MRSVNSISGTRLQPHYVKGFALGLAIGQEVPRRGGDGQTSPVPVVKWAEQPTHPMVAQDLAVVAS